MSLKKYKFNNIILLPGIVQTLVHHHKVGLLSVFIRPVRYKTILHIIMENIKT